MQSRNHFEVTLGCVLFIPEYLWEWRFHNLSMQPGAVFDHSHSKCVFLIYLIRISLAVTCLCWLSSFCYAHLRSLLYICPLGICKQLLSPVQSLLFFMLNSSSSLSLPLHVMLQPLLALIACCWTQSSTPMTSLFWGSCSWTWYLRCSPTTAG